MSIKVIAYTLLFAIYSHVIFAQKENKWRLDAELGVNANMRLTFTLRGPAQQSSFPHTSSRPTIRPQLGLQLSRKLSAHWQLNAGLLSKTLGYKTISARVATPERTEDFLLAGFHLGGEYQPNRRWKFGAKLHLYHYFIDIYQNDAGEISYLEPSLFGQNEWLYSLDLQTFYVINKRLELGLHYEYLLNGLYPSIYDPSQGRTFYKLQALGILARWRLWAS